MNDMKCKYYRESDIEQYTPTCTGVGWSMHPEDIHGEYCTFCGKKIKFKDDTPVPQELLEEEY